MASFLLLFNVTTLSREKIVSCCAMDGSDYRCRTMKQVFVILFASLMSGAADTQELRTTIDQWVGVMENLHKEKSRWVREREVMESSKEGLITEIEDLKEKIEELEVSAQAASQEDQVKIAKKQSYEDAKTQLGNGLGKLISRVPELLKLVPTSYMKENPKLQNAEKAWDTVKEAEDGKLLGKKVSLLVDLLLELESFNQQIWDTQEAHKVDGDGEHLLQTIYLGLGAAYATNEEGTIALIGHPSSINGWSFKEVETKAAAQEIKKLIITATGKGGLEFSKIPLEVR